MQVLFIPFTKLLPGRIGSFFIFTVFLIGMAGSSSSAQDTAGYYADGSLRFRGRMMDSLREGLWIFYYPGGPVSAKMPYHLGELDGLAYYYDDHSELIALENWSNGLQEDSSWYFYPNGIVEKKGRFRHSLHDGKWAFYYISGVIKRIGTYINGIPEGEWEFYNEKAIKIQEGQFKNGLEDGNWVFFDIKGRKTYLGTFSSGKRSGTWYKVRKSGDTRIYRKYPVDN
jgi:antitoxin component YwqK of YwqJK toxin-antitoxin module